MYNEVSVKNYISLLQYIVFRDFRVVCVVAEVVVQALN